MSWPLDLARPAFTWPALNNLTVPRLLVAPALAVLLAAPGVHAQQTEANGWRWHLESIASGVNQGFQLALDPIAGRVYVADAEWRSEKRDADGAPWLQRTASGKLVLFDSNDRTLVDLHSFLGLSRTDGSGTEREPLDWSNATEPDQEIIASMQSTFSPYGVAVDGTTLGAGGQPDATIITTTARGRDHEAGYGGHLVVYKASQGAPTDADRIWRFKDDSPVFDGMRRVVINTKTHKAYITNVGEFRKTPDRRPGFIAVVDLPTKTVEARVQIPVDSGPIGVAVDEGNNLVYIGSLVNTKLHVFDAGKVDTSNPQDLALNAGLVTRLEQAEVGGNSRPEYDPMTKRLYVAKFDKSKGSITVLDADPVSAGYGTVLMSVETGQVNALTVDAKRGLLISANLEDKEVVIHDLNTLNVILRIPTSGAPVNTAVAPVSGDIWVANLGKTGRVDVITIRPPE
jgi:DNA-binding beta-propeller fold protein YncE